MTDPTAEILSLLDRKLLDHLQRSFPLIERPFAQVGEQLGLAEREVLSRLKELKAKKILRQIGAIFDTEGCGYTSALVAATLPENSQNAIERISAHPGVSHHYERAHRYNSWFTMAVQPGRDLRTEVAHLSEQSGGWPFLVLPVIRRFKIGMILDMGGLTEEHAPLAEPISSAKRSSCAMTPLQIEVVRTFQEPLSLIERPFDPFLKMQKLSMAELAAIFEQMRQEGKFRRFAALLFHRNAGYSANAMVAWNVSAVEVERWGRAFSALSAVTHCYERQTFPEWPMNLYTMIHARAREDLLEIVAKAASPSGLAHEILWTLSERKKIRLKLFLPT